MVDVVLVDVEVLVDVLVEVEAAVVTGVVVDVVPTSELDVEMPIDDDVDDSSVDCVLSLLHPTMASASASNGTTRRGFTTGSLACCISIT